jgi:hypothetical protein
VSQHDRIIIELNYFYVDLWTFLKINISLEGTFSIREWFDSFYVLLELVKVVVVVVLAVAAAVVVVVVVVLQKYL